MSERYQNAQMLVNVTTTFCAEHTRDLCAAVCGVDSHRQKHRRYYDDCTFDVVLGREEFCTTIGIRRDLAGIKTS